MSQQQERAVLAQRLAAAFNATRHLSLEELERGVVSAQEGAQP